MYGTNAQYGWSNGPRSNQIVELPLAPVRRRPANECCPGGISWLSYGIITSLLAAASLALGVADVVLTYQTYMVDKKCNDNQSAAPCDKNNLVWTWVAVGIWASLPIFIFGILAIRLGKRRNPWGSPWFELLAFLSAFIFAPAMVVLSAMEVSKGKSIYYWTGWWGSDDLAKAIIPIVIAGLGAIECLLALIAIFYLCCGRQGYSGGEVVYQQNIDVGSRTFVQAKAPCGPCQTNFAPRMEAPRVTSCSTGACGGGGNGVYYRPATTTGFAPRPTTYNYFSNSRPTNFSPYNQFR